MNKIREIVELVIQILLIYSQIKMKDFLHPQFSCWHATH